MKGVVSVWSRYMRYVWCEECGKLYPEKDILEYGTMEVVYEYVARGNGEIVEKTYSEYVEDNPAYYVRYYECPEGHEIPVDDRQNYLPAKYVVLVREEGDGVVAVVDGGLVGKDGEQLEVRAEDVGGVEKQIRAMVGVSTPARA